MATNNDILKEKMLSALEKSLGIVTSAAKNVNISRSTHYDWLIADPIYKKNVDELVNIALDFAESQLFQSIKNGSDTATIFLLKTKGKSRGYIERTETDITSKGEKIGSTIDVTKLSDSAIDELLKATT